MIEYFHIIKNSSNNLAYHYPSATLIEINPFVADLLLDIQKGVPLDKIALTTGTSEKDLSEFINKFYSSVPQKEKGEICKPIKRKIDRITLHVSNDCNLRCIYCYGNGGSYGMDRRLMDENTAIDFVHFFTNRFDEIGGIVFFGGEPLMNIPVIEKVCVEFKRLAEIGKIQKVPDFGIITNGTILNQKVLDLINKHINRITVSIDGPKEVNDLNRIFADGVGSYDRIANFIRTIKQETNAFIKYEGTISSNHVKLGISEADVANYLESEFNIGGTIATDILDENIDNNSSATLEKKQDDKLYLSSDFINLLSGIVYNSKRKMCLVGSEIIAVAVDGTMYPCHMNSGKEHLSFGNIYGKNIFDDENFYYEKFPFLNHISKQNGECKSCWVQKLCGGCAIRWFFNKNTDSFLICFL